MFDIIDSITEKVCRKEPTKIVGQIFTLTTDFAVNISTVKINALLTSIVHFTILRIESRPRASFFSRKYFQRHIWHKWQNKNKEFLCSIHSKVLLLEFE